MNTASDEHPSEELLIAFAEGRLSNTETDVVSGHVEFCDECAAKVDAVTVEPESLIVDPDSTATIVGLVPGPHASATASTVQRPSADPMPDAEFEHHEVIGTGGMGVVYRAWQPDVCRFVAVKYLNSALPPEDPRSTKAIARFKREVRALGRVQHPNLVQIYTSGATAEGRLYYSMELIRGVNLSVVFRLLCEQQTNAPDWNVALAAAYEETAWSKDYTELPGQRATLQDYVTIVVSILRQVAMAVECLHQAGIVHRDIKPANIMISSEDGRAVLMDLGLAGLVDEQETRLTGTGLIAGSLPYISPEQFRAEQPSQSGDIYNLGAVLWEFLALKRLFGADVKSSQAATINRIINEDPSAPRTDRANAHADLAAIALKCLEKDPSRRYQRIADLVQDLDQYTAGKKVSAPRHSVGAGVLRFLRKHRTAAKWIAGITVAQVALVIAAALLATTGFRDDADGTTIPLPTRIDDRGLVGHWTADGTGGVAIDSSGNKRSGQLKGNTFRENGVTGNAFWFDGNGDYIDCGKSPRWNFLHDGSPFSISASIAPVSANEDGGIVATNDEHTTTTGFQGVCMRLDGSSRIEFYIQGVGPTFPLRLKAEWQIPSNRFTSAAVTFDGREGRIYINGDVAAIDGAMGSFVENDASDALSIGSIGTADSGPNKQAFDFFEGGIDDVRIYNRVLSEAEVRILARNNAATVSNAVLE